MSPEHRSILAFLHCSASVGRPAEIIEAAEAVTRLRNRETVAEGVYDASLDVYRLACLHRNGGPKHLATFIRRRAEMLEARAVRDAARARVAAELPALLDRLSWLAIGETFTNADKVTETAA